MDDRFQGDPEDLDEFMKLVKTPIRNESRTKALAAWRDYKSAKLARLWPDVARELFGGPPIEGLSPFMKGWNMIAMRHHLIDLSGANLDGICLGFIDLRGVKLDGASLRGAWLKNAELECTSLRNADLSPLPLEGGGANATRLIQSDLSDADLGDANLSLADLTDTVFRGADLRGANMRDADLTRSNLVGAKLDGTNLNGSRIYGISAWDVSLCPDDTKRQNLIVTTPDQPEVRIDDIEVAQFIYLLLNRNKLRKVINAVTQKGVLILGRFSDGGLVTLRDIAESIREHGYLPMLFDFDKPDDRDYTETVKTLAGLARFVIVDLSGPSVPQELMATVPHVEIPFIPILQEGLKPHSMFRDLLKYRWVYPDIVYFSDSEALSKKLLPKVVQPAEKIIEEKQRRMSSY